MEIQKGSHVPRPREAEHKAHAWHEPGSDFVLVEDFQPPPRIELARERMLMCRLYIGLIRSISKDYGAAFAAHSDSSTFRMIWNLCVSSYSDVFAGERQQDSEFSQTATRNCREASAGNGQAWICGARRQCLPCHRQGKCS